MSLLRFRGINDCIQKTQKSVTTFLQANVPRCWTSKNFNLREKKIILSCQGRNIVGGIQYQCCLTRRRVDENFMAVFLKLRFSLKVKLQRTYQSLLQIIARSIFPGFQEENSRKTGKHATRFTASRNYVYFIKIRKAKVEEDV